MNQMLLAENYSLFFMAIYKAQVRKNSLYFFQGVSSCKFSTTCGLYIAMLFFSMFYA